MELNEKIELFSRAAMQEAVKKYSEIIEDIEKEYNTAIDEAENQARKRAEISLQTEKYKAGQVKHKETLNAAAECKRMLIEQRSKLLDQLFEEVITRLHNFTGSDEYKDYLIKQITDKSESYKNVEIKLRSNDMKYAAEINKLTGVSVTETGDDFIGGFKMMLADKRAVLDATFASRLKHERKNFNKFSKY